MLNCINIPFWIQSHKRFFFFYLLVRLYNSSSFKKKNNAWYYFSIKFFFKKLRCMTMQAVLSRKIRGVCVLTTHVFCREIKFLWIGYTNSIVHEDKGCFVVFFLSKTPSTKVAKCIFRYLDNGDVTSEWLSLSLLACFLTNKDFWCYILIMCIVIFTINFIYIYIYILNDSLITSALALTLNWYR